MQRRDWTLRVHDILEAIARIQRYVAGLSFEEFARDEKTLDAVVRNLEVIGEAARHIPNELEALNPDVPWTYMRGMRNVLAHEYFGVDASILWHTAQNDLPPLVQPLQSMLGESGPQR